MPEEEPKPVLSYAGPMTNVEPRWETLRVCQNGFEANLLVGALTQVEITARTDGENLSGLGHWGVSGGGGVKVQVVSTDFERAKILLAEVDAAAEKRREAGIVRCPRCNSPGKRVLHPIRKLGLFLIIAPIIVGWFFSASGIELPIIGYTPMPLGVILLVITRVPRWRCPGCGNRWAQPEPDETDQPESTEEAEKT